MSASLLALSHLVHSGSNKIACVPLRFSLSYSNIVGIDLGTTNSCCAVMESGNAKVIENSEGKSSSFSRQNLIAETFRHLFEIMQITNLAFIVI